MFIFHTKTTIKDVSGYNCAALSNPAGSGKTLKVTKIEISSPHLVDVALLSGSVEAANPEQFVTYTIRNSKVGDTSQTVAEATYEPTFIQPTYLIKSASIQDGTQRKLIDNSDFLTVPEGQTIGIRAVAGRVLQDIHLTFVYDEVNNEEK